MQSVLLALADIQLGFLQSWINFGVVSIASAQIAFLVTYLKLPLITGYLFFGLLIGPQLCELVTKTDLSNLQYITEFALGFICLSAGAELYLPELKALLRRILVLTGLLTVITFVVVLIVVYLESLAGWTPYSADFVAGVSQNGCNFSIAMICASIMISQSPASAIAIVRELAAKGPFTSTMLGVCVLIDVVVLLLASIATSIANTECQANSEGFQILDLVITLITLALAVLEGWLLGKIIIFTIWLPRVPGEYLVPFMGFGVFQLSSWLLDWSTVNIGHGINPDPLLICIVGGYVVANQSRNRRKFLRFFNKAGPVIFIPFFTLTGAGLKLGVILNSVPFALVTSLVRALSFAAATALGGRYTGMERKQSDTLWLGMITQAGVSLGIAAQVATLFPSFGADFQSTMISVILINQVLGPIACAYTLAANGEAGQAIQDDEDDERVKRCLLIGVTDDSLAIAQRLLNKDWDVIFCDTDETRLALSHVLRAPVRKHSHDADSSPPTLTVHVPHEDDHSRESLGPHGLSALTQEPVASSISPRFADKVNNRSLDSEIELSSSRATEADVAPASPSAMQSMPLPSVQVTSHERVTERITTRLVELPTLLLKAQQSQSSGLLNTSGSSDIMQTSSRFARQHEALVASYAAVLKDLDPVNTHAFAIFLSSDSQAWAISDYLLSKQHLPHAVAQINNPNWSTMFASIGVLPMYSFSCTVAMMTQAVLSHAGSKFELINRKKPIQTELAKLIKPEATNTVPIHLTYSSAEDQQQFLDAHPNPPLATDQLWKFDEKFQVVNQAQRDEYLHDVYRVHASRIDLNTRRQFQRAKSTFSGPSMANSEHDEGKDDNIAHMRRLRRRESSIRHQSPRHSLTDNIHVGHDDDLDDDFSDSEDDEEDFDPDGNEQSAVHDQDARQ